MAVLFLDQNISETHRPVEILSRIKYLRTFGKIKGLKQYV
jgi:hypothetical protein